MASLPGDRDPLSTSRALAPFVVAVVFTVTSTISVALRLIALRMKRARLTLSDYTILAAQVCEYFMAACVILEVFIGGAGHHVQDVSPHRVVNLLKILVVLQILYGISLGLVKTSICLFYIKIFFIRPFRIVTWIVMAVIVAWSTMVVLTAFLLCRPLAFNWDPTIPGGKCGNQPATFIAVGALNIATDLLVLCLPIPMVWKLQIPRANKIALSGVFGVGFFAVIISVLRINYLVAVSYDDITYTAAYPFLWSLLEPAIGITVACAPLMRPLFEKVFVNRFHLRGGTAVSSSSEEGGKVASAKKRLDKDAYPLTSAGGNLVTCAGSNGHSGNTSLDETDDLEGRGPQETPASNRREFLGGIGVKSEWSVRHH